MLMELSLPSFETVIINYQFTYMTMYNSCSNELVSHLRVLDI